MVRTRNRTISGSLLVVDTGGTKTRVRLADMFGITIEEFWVTTDRESPSSTFVDLVTEAGARGWNLEDVVAVCIAVAGRVVNTTIIGAGNLTGGWINTDLRESLPPIWADRLVVINDVAAAALGIYTNESGEQPLVAVGWGTGLGIGAVLSGGYVHSTEGGHAIIDVCSGRRCGDGCRGFGHFESFVGGAAVSKHFGVENPGLLTPKQWQSILNRMAAGLHTAHCFFPGLPIYMMGGQTEWEAHRIDTLRSMLSELPGPAGVVDLRISALQEPGLIGATEAARRHAVLLES